MAFTSPLKNVLSERNQIVLFIVLAIGVLAAVWHFAFRGISEQRAENAAERERLAKMGFSNQTKEELAAKVDHEKEVRAMLEAEWTNAVAKLETISGSSLYGRDNVLRIDYKVHLLQARDRIRRKADQLGIKLTEAEMGMSEEVFSTDDPRVLMVQLLTAERMVDLALERRIQNLVRVHPLPPVEHNDGAGALIFEEFPVEVGFDVDFESFYDLFHVVFEEGRLFVFKNVRITSGATAEAPLRVRATLSSMVFPGKGAVQTNPAEAK